MTNLIDQYGLCLFLCNPFMYLFAEPCKHHYPVAYCVMFKHFFWTQIFTSIPLVFCHQALSISQAECHMVPHLDSFAINSHNAVYKQHLCWVSSWLLLCCNSLRVTGEARWLLYCTKSKQFNFDTLLVMKKILSNGMCY